MSITDELRKYAEDWDWLDMPSKEAQERIEAIADRIDAEHERQLEVLYRDMSDAEYVKLPKDADGEYIHIGDVMEWPEDGETFEVVGIGDGWTLFYVIEDGVAEWTRAENKRHHQPDTWERIIEDAIRGDGGSYGCLEERFNATVPALVARCRALAGDAS